MILPPKKPYKILEVFFGGFLAPHLSSDVVLFMIKLVFFLKIDALRSESLLGKIIVM